MSGRHAGDPGDDGFDPLVGAGRCPKCGTALSGILPPVGVDPLEDHEIIDLWRLAVMKYGPNAVLKLRFHEGRWEVQAQDQGDRVGLPCRQRSALPTAGFRMLRRVLALAVRRHS